MYFGLKRPNPGLVFVYLQPPPRESALNARVTYRPLPPTLKINFSKTRRGTAMIFGGYKLCLKSFNLSHKPPGSPDPEVVSGTIKKKFEVNF